MAKATRKWSGEVTKNSNALDLDKGVFKQGSAKKIAKSLERSADKSDRKKSDSYRSAMSMLSFYINRAGKNLPASQKKILEKAKEILRQDHEKNPQPNGRAGSKTGTTSPRANPRSTGRSGPTDAHSRSTGAKSRPTATVRSRTR